MEGSLVRQVALRNKIQAELAFLAPEQTHSTGFVDHLTDIYSLGVAVYALLTGKMPFEGASQAELVGQIRDGVPTKPKKYQPAIPDRMEWVVLKMLAKRPEERPGSARAVADDLAACERDLARPAAWRPRLALAALTLLVLAALAAAWGFQKR